MLIIPAIDLKDGKCVRLRQGRMSDSTVFNGSPLEIAGRWIEAGARRLHDIGKSGWWQLIAITIIGIIPLIIWFAKEGTKKNNSHGKPIKLKK